jgi:hypothetical protein
VSEIRRIVLTIAWLLIVGVISIGGAGIVAAMANPPGAVPRPELTMDGDAGANAALDQALVELRSLTGEVERLGELGRGALTALVASQFEVLDGAVTEGQDLARQIETHSARIREQLRRIPGSGPTESLIWSPDTIRRRDAALKAVDLTAGLEVAWTRLASGSVVANRLTSFLTAHDTTAAKAVKEYEGSKFSASLKTLASAQGMLEQAKDLRDRLRNTVDVTTLTQWIDRNDEYDAAFKTLVQETVKAKGAVTKALRDAYLAERKAHALLPANTSGIVIILGEIGRGGLNEAVIGIEEARASLQAALDELDPDATVPAAPEASAAPDSSSAPADGGATPPP